MPEKTALVLSAGGFFGAYQAGAWKAIARDFQPDLIVGASVGALNGWSIAGGADPGELVREWLDPETASLLKLHVKPGIRNGYFVPGPLLRKAETLISHYVPKIPFGLVVVELPWLRTRLIRDKEVRPAHLLATCSIPFILPSVRIGGTRFTDGGLLEVLPIWAAVQMGATRIVAVDSLPRVTPWWVQTGVRVMRTFRRQQRVPPHVKVTTIAPAEYMGTAHDAVIWRRDNIARWIAMGERDAAREFRLQ